MNQKPDIPILSPSPDSIAIARQFSHQAMSATFEIFIVHPDADYARQAAHAAFDLLDQLEGDLSRFIENSDISRINNLCANQPLQLGLAAFESLQLCSELYDETGGAFDVNIGFLMDCWLDENKKTRRPSKKQLDFARSHSGMQLIEVNEVEYTVKLTTSPVKIDLGGFGKGYAIDKIAELLRQWSINTALISGGFSTVLALDPLLGEKGWPVTITNPINRTQTIACLDLANHALSGSGIAKGSHIIDPCTAKPVKNKIAAWSSATSAATADALSTAFMVMTTEDVSQYCENHPGTMAVLITQEEKIQRLAFR